MLAHSDTQLEFQFHRPEDDEEAMFQWMKSNFERNYLGSRAPFGVFIHAAWFLVRDSHWPAYKRLVEHMNSLPDVYLVSVGQALEYTRNPRPVWTEEEEEVVAEAVPEQGAEEVESGNGQQQEEEAGHGGRSGRRHTQIMDECQKLREPTCHPKLCQLRKETTNEERWMTSCATCPEVYPWLGNPLGVATRLE